MNHAEKQNTNLPQFSSQGIRCTSRNSDKSQANKQSDTKTKQLVNQASFISGEPETKSPILNSKFTGTPMTLYNMNDSTSIVSGGSVLGKANIKHKLKERRNIKLQLEK